MKVFVVVEIGCLECGEESQLLGVYLSEEEARRKHVIDEGYPCGQCFTVLFPGELNLGGQILG